MANSPRDNMVNKGSQSSTDLADMFIPFQDTFFIGGAFPMLQA